LPEQESADSKSGSSWSVNKRDAIADEGRFSMHPRIKSHC